MAASCHETWRRESNRYRRIDRAMGTAIAGASFATKVTDSLAALRGQQSGSLGPGGDMTRRSVLVGVVCIATVVLVLISRPVSSADALDGKSIFRFDTFGDEQLWTNTLHLERAVATLPPSMAL